MSYALPSSLFSVVVIAAGDTPNLSIFALLMGLFGGLALFLFGMDQMAEALKAVTESMRRSVSASLRER